MKLKIRIDSTEAENFTKQLLPTILRAAQSGFQDFMNQVANRVREKLTGPVLKRRTGTLVRSIHTEIQKSATGFIGKIGSNLKYAAIHEFGGIIHIPDIYPVKKKALSFFIGGEKIVVKKVKAHTITMPERSYLRSSLAELAPQAEKIIMPYIEEALQNA